MKYKVVCFDLDGTIIDDIEYIWYVLHEYFNINMEYVKKWHKMFDDGKVNYEEWFNEDIKWWNEAGATKEGFFEVVKKLKLMEGAVDTIRELKKNGVKIAIISGSLNIVLDYFFPDKPFDYVYINEIFFGEDGKISGNKITQYDFKHKATAVNEIVEKENIDVSECVFVGDNYNDIEAVKTAGLGISFNSSSEELNSVADVVIKKKDLREILNYI